MTLTINQTSSSAPPSSSFDSSYLMFQRKNSEQAIKVNNFTKLVELLERCALTCSTCFFCYCDTRYKIPQMPVWSVSQTIVFSDLITHSGDNVQTGERYDMINLSRWALALRICPEKKAARCPWPRPSSTPPTVKRRRSSPSSTLSGVSGCVVPIEAFLLAEALRILLCPGLNTGWVTSFDQNIS